MFKLTRKPEHATEYRPDGGERLIGENGELNASTKAELIKRQAQLASAIKNGKIASLSSAERMQNNKESFEELSAAYHDKTTSAWEELGSMVSATLNTAIEREGFMRRILVKGDLAQGSFPRHRVKRINTQASMATGASSISPTYIRDNYLMPPEFNIHSNLLILNKEINQGSADILDEKYNETLKQIMVTEDRLLIKQAKALADIDNDIVYVTGAYTPQSIAQIRGQVTYWGLAPSLILIAANVMEDMIGSPTFANFFDPVSKYDIIMTGQVGTLYGTEILTDQFRDPNLKVLNSGDVIAFGPPDYVGAYTDRGPVESVAIDHRMVNNVPARGWYFNEDMSMALHQGRGISQGSR